MILKWVDNYVKKHIYGEGISDVFKMIGKKVFGKTAKEAAKTATKTALQTADPKTGKYAGEKAGDKIIQLLSKKNKNTITASIASPIENPQTRELSDYEIRKSKSIIILGPNEKIYLIY